MDRFDAMHAFVRVVDTGSFTRAAESLRISRTTATQLVQQLEARLQIRLLNRTTRRVALTAEGAIYYARAVRLLADLEDAEGSLSNAAAAPRGRLRIDVPTPLARLVLVPALPAFHARYPGIVLDLGVSDRMVDLIGDHVDCVIRGGDITDLSLIARKVADLRIGLYAAPAYLSRIGAPAHPREVTADSPHRLVAFQSMRTGQQPLPFVLHRGGERIEVRGRHVLAVDDGNAYIAAGVAGLGLLAAPDYIAKPHVDAGELVPVLTDWRLDSMPLYLAYPENRYVSARLRVFIDWAVDMFKREFAHQRMAKK